MFFFSWISCVQLKESALLIRGRNGTSTESRKKASWWRQCDALGNFLLGNLGSDHSCGFTFTHTTYFCCRPSTKLQGNGISLKAVASFSRIMHPTTVQKIVQSWFEKDDKGFNLLTWRPNSPDLNPIKYFWNVLDKVRSMEEPPCNLLVCWFQIPQHTFL